MRNPWKLVVVLGAAALLAGPALAQSPPIPTIHYDLSLLLNPSVQKELKLDEQQIVKVRQLFEQSRAKIREHFEALRDLQGQERSDKAAQLTDALNADTEKALA